MNYSILRRICKVNGSWNSFFYKARLPSANNAGSPLHLCEWLRRTLNTRLRLCLLGRGRLPSIPTLWSRSRCQRRSCPHPFFHRWCRPLRRHKRYEHGFGGWATPCKFFCRVLSRFFWLSPWVLAHLRQTVPSQQTQRSLRTLPVRWVLFGSVFEPLQALLLPTSRRPTA